MPDIHSDEMWDAVQANLAHSPSEPSGLDDCGTAEDVAYYWRRQALEARSAIEAAQIAARNEALEEAAKVASDGETLHRRGDSKDWRDGYETACNYIAAALRSLRTPSQHQEEQ